MNMNSQRTVANTGGKKNPLSFKVLAEREAKRFTRLYTYTPTNPDQGISKTKGRFRKS